MIATDLDRFDDQIVLKRLSSSDTAPHVLAWPRYYAVIEDKTHRSREPVLIVPSLLDPEFHGYFSHRC